jgi:hypothetical protein
VLHLLHIPALRDHKGWITCVQIGAEYSHIDFKLDSFLLRSASSCNKRSMPFGAEPSIGNGHPYRDPRPIPMLRVSLSNRSTALFARSLELAPKSPCARAADIAADVKNCIRL